MAGIGRRVREYRLINGIKIKEFADKLGISQGTLSDIENEKTNPSSDTITSIIHLLDDVNPKWIIEGIGCTYIADRGRNRVGSWIEQIIDVLKVNKIVIITYEDTDLSGGLITMYLVLLVTPDNLYSAGGGALELATTAARSTYADMLRFIKNKGISIFKKTYKSGESSFWNLHNFDFSPFLDVKRTEELNIDEEINSITAWRRPNFKIEEVKELLKSESDDFIEQILQLLQKRRADTEKLEGLRSKKVE